jgi:hypothetical protein
MKNKRDWVGLLGGVVLIVSLFMPWISAGSLSQRAIDINYGYVLLAFGAIACLLAIINLVSKNTLQTQFIFPTLGILSGLVLYQNYIDLARNAMRIEKDFPFLKDFVQGFIGIGVYVGFVGCLLLISVLFIKSE